MKKIKPFRLRDVVAWAGGKYIEHYSPQDFVTVKPEISRWIALNNDKSIVRMRGEYTIEATNWIYWN